VIRTAILLSLLATLIYSTALADENAVPAATGVMPPPKPEAAAAPQPTQRDWLKNMVDGLGWGFGLPDEPTDDDYLAIVSGQRSLRLEAEEIVPPSEPVSTKNYHNFGPFSGQGWVSGISTPTTARLPFLLPLGGRYQVRAALRLPGHTLTIGGKEFKADGKQHFSTVDLGSVELAAGPQTVLVALPPDGGIDFIELEAHDLTPISPIGGWQLDKPLTRETLAVTSIQTLDLLAQLPPQGSPLHIEAEQANLPATAQATEARHLGAPSRNAWVRAGGAGSLIELEFIPPQAGVYRLSVRGLAGQALRADVDGKIHFSAPFPEYLATRQGPSIWLDKTPHRFRIELPPRAGLDAIILQPLASGKEDFLNLSGLRSLDEKVRFADLDRLLPLLTLLTPQR